MTNKNPDELINIIQSLQETLLKNQKQLQNKDILIACLNDTIALMKHEKFASRSEKYIDNSLQGRLFNEAESSEKTADIEEA